MKNKTNLLIIMSAIILSFSTPIFAANSEETQAMSNSVASTEFNPAQKTAIEKITHDYLVQHPEVLMEAAQALQAKQTKALQTQALSAISQNKQQLFQDPKTPTGGAENGKLLLVEFFDYQCGHCKAMEPILLDTLKNNNNVKIIYKELPIFGDSSEFAAKAALASVKQGKYEAFHKALFLANKSLTATNVMQIAQSVGIDTKQLAEDMKDPAIEQQVKANFELAQAMRLVGTPSFVIANSDMTQFDFIPGATSKDDLQQRFNKISKKSN